jgi:hypothetical protein
MHSPDVIQRSPENYFAYVRATSLAYSAMQGKSDKEANLLADQIVSELRPVATIPTTQTRYETSWLGALLAPWGYGASGGTPLTSSQVALSDEELDESSVEMLRGMLEAQGADMRYRPEKLGSGIAQLVLPWFGSTTQEEAVGDLQASFLERDSVRNRLTPIVSADETRAAVQRTMTLIKRQPAVVVESPSGQTTSKRQ